MVCIETTILVDILRGKKEAKILLESLDKKNEVLTVAAPSVTELISGAILYPKVEKEKDKVIEFLSSFIILNLDMKSAILAGEIEAKLSKRGEMIEIDDVMIAAIAKSNNESLVTKNKKHFERIDGLRIETY